MRALTRRGGARAARRRTRARAVLPLTPAAMTLPLVLLYKALLEQSVERRKAAKPQTAAGTPGTAAPAPPAPDGPAAAGMRRTPK